MLSATANHAEPLRKQSPIGRIWADHRGMVVLLALFLVLGALYSVATPLFEASDELWHYPFVERLADGQGLPVQKLDQLGPWRQEGSQPPLYYALAALLTSGIDTSDMDAVRWINPHADIGILTADRNVNMVIHPQGARVPLRGTALAVMLTRWASVLLGAITVLAAYLLARELFPQDRVLALGSAGLTAFNAMFLFISASVNNDNLVTMLCAVCLWLIVKLVSSDPRPAQWTLLGALIGLASLSKASALALLPLAGLALCSVAYRARSWRTLWVGALALGLPVVAIAGWWYYRNWRLYRDPLGLSAFVAIVGARYPMPTLRQLLGEWKGFVMSFWGFFGGVNVAAPGWVYWVLSLLGLAGLLGVPVYLWRARRAGDSPLPALALMFVALWPCIIFVALIRWTLMTIASQGRLMFPALTAINLFIALGWLGWFPRRWRAAGLATMNIAMLVIAAMLPFTTIMPAYRQPRILHETQVLESYRQLGATFGERMQLLGYRFDQDALAPGETLCVTLYWKSLAAMAEDYSVFVHLVGENDLIIGQRDMYPGQGNYPTTLWKPGDIIEDTYCIAVSDTALTPSQAELVVGLYNLKDGTRLPVRDARGVAIGDSLRFGRLSLPAREANGIPNPVHLNFADRIALVGYSLDRTAAAPGEAYQLTLYWQALRDLDVNYSVFTHVLGEQHRIWAQMDGWPQGGNAPTATWRKGQIIEDHYTLTVASDAPPGVYQLEIGLYSQDGKRLNLLGAGGHVRDTRIVLAKVRILPTASR